MSTTPTIHTASIGRIAWAVQSDRAEAAALALTSSAHAGHVMESCPDTAVTLTDLASEVARQSSASLTYRDVLEEELRNSLAHMGMPDVLSALLAEANSRTEDVALGADIKQFTLLNGASMPIEGSASATLAA